MNKVCLVCGRQIEPRKKWAKAWPNIKYCGEKCRRAKSSLGVSAGHEDAILDLLKKRGRGKTICPSEILPEGLKKDRAKMEEVRQAARRLVQKGKIHITQKGIVVDPSTARGPIRLKLA